MEDMGFEFRRRGAFLLSMISRTALRPIHSPIQWLLASGKAARVHVDLSLHLVLRLKTIGAIPLLPLYSYMSLIKPILCFYVALNYEMTVSNDWDKIC